MYDSFIIPACMTLSLSFSLTLHSSPVPVRDHAEVQPLEGAHQLDGIGCIHFIGQGIPVCTTKVVHPLLVQSVRGERPQEERRGKQQDVVVL